MLKSIDAVVPTQRANRIHNVAARVLCVLISQRAGRSSCNSTWTTICPESTWLFPLKLPPERKHRRLPQQCVQL